MKWLIVLPVLGVLAAIAVALWVTHVENTQHSQNQAYIDQHKRSAPPLSDTAVIVFSRSGNTGVLAQHIADTTDADIHEICAKDYELGIPGWISALRDARKTIATITPNDINLKQYTTVYLGSPIWLYSPAPPIWQFANDQDFTGKDVILFNTFNSKFEQSYIDDFQSLVMANGAKSFKHRYVNRGRMGNQLTTEQMLDVFDSGNQL